MSTTGYGLGHTNPNKEDNSPTYTDENSLITQIDAGNKLTRSTVDENNFGATNLSAANALTSSSSELTFGDEDFTICAWVNFGTLVLDKTIVSRYSSVTGNNVFALKISGSNVQKLEFIVSNNGTAETSLVAVNTSLFSGGFQLVVAVHDSTNNELRIYKNRSIDSGGGVDTVAHTTGASNDATLDFRIGSNHDGSDPIGAADVVDKVAVYNKAFTQSDVDYYFNAISSEPDFAGAGRNYSDIDRNNLGSFWNFEEASGPRFDSHGSNDLAVVGSPSTETGMVVFDHFINIPRNGVNVSEFNGTSIVNKHYFQFDGIDQRLSINEDLEQTPKILALTVSFWIRRTGSPATGDIVFAKYKDIPSTVLEFYIWKVPAQPDDSLGFSIDSGTPNGFNSTGVLPLDQWVFLTWTLITNSTGKVYINGDFHETGNTMNSNFVNAASTRIFVGGSSAGNSYPCDVSEVTIDRRTLTEPEILKRYKATKHRFNN